MEVPDESIRRNTAKRTRLSALARSPLIAHFCRHPVSPHVAPVGSGPTKPAENAASGDHPPLLAPVSESVSPFTAIANVTVPSMRLSAVLALGLVASTALPSCRDRPSLTTNTRSESLPTPEERVAFLGRYLRFRSAVRDAAFDINYHDNSTGLLPGPSDWTMWAGLLLPTGAISSWLEDARPCQESPKPELERIVPATWKVSSPARCLERDGSTLLVHDTDDVLVFYASAH